MTISKLSSWCLIGIVSMLSWQAFAQTTVINNVKGYSLNNDGTLFEFTSLTVSNGKIVGTDQAIGNQTDFNIVDGKGRVLLPGLIDAHGHLLGLGANLLEVDLRDSQSASDAASKVADYAFANGYQYWITGRGWNQELWPDKAFPIAKDIDKQVPNRPVWLTRVDGHAGWANSKALELADIDLNTPEVEGGLIVRDADGKPTGVLIDNAMYLLEKVMPKSNAAVYRQQLKAAGEHLVSLGITSMHDAGVNQSVYEFYLAEAAKGTLPLRIYAMLSATDPNLDMMLANGPVRSRDDMLYVRSVKAYGDGALGSRGAALIKPYSDSGQTRGLLLTQESAMQALFTKVLGNGFQLNYHAIGDRANHLALNAFEQAYTRNDGKYLRNRIEHAQVIDVDDIHRFVELDVLPSMQPTHATSDMNMAEARIGKKRMQGAYAWKTLLESGIPLPLGSDFPVELANPFYGIHAAVTRQNRQNQPQPGWYDHEALTVEQAFRGFTLDAAYAAHMESVLGTLEPGKWADFIILDKDIFQVPATELWQVEVLETWIGGKRVYPLSEH